MDAPTKPNGRADANGDEPDGRNETIPLPFPVESSSQDSAQPAQRHTTRKPAAIKGWVYVISNKGMPGLVKVGYSSRDPELRARELNHTGAAHPYVVDYEALVDEPYFIEQRIHRELSLRREGREWFRCSPEQVIATLNYITGGKHHAETFKRAEREKADRIFEEQLRAEKLEAAISVRVADALAKIDALFKEELATRFPEIKFWPYCVGWALGTWVSFELFLNPKSSVGAFILAAIVGAIAAAFHTSHISDKRKESAEYKALLKDKDIGIAEAEKIIRSQESNFSAAEVPALLRLMAGMRDNPSAATAVKKALKKMDL